MKFEKEIELIELLLSSKSSIQKDKILEKVWGSRKFFIFYLITGIGAGVLYSGVNFIENFNLENKVSRYASQPSPEAFRKLFLDEGKEYYNQVYNFIEDEFSVNPTSSKNKDKSIRYAYDLLNTKTDIPMVGASGAVFGILLAFAMLFRILEFKWSGRPAKILPA